MLILLLAGFMISFIFLNETVLIFIIPTILFGISFYLDGKETMKHGKEIIIKYEQNFIIRNFTKKFGLNIAMISQGLMEGLALGWLIPFLFQDFYWQYVTILICIFASFVHITGYVHNRQLLTNETKCNIYSKLLFDVNVTSLLKR